MRLADGISTFSSIDWAALEGPDAYWTPAHRYVGEGFRDLFGDEYLAQASLLELYTVVTVGYAASIASGYGAVAIAGSLGWGAFGTAVFAGGVGGLGEYTGTTLTALAFDRLDFDGVSTYDGPTATGALGFTAMGALTGGVLHGAGTVTRSLFPKTSAALGRLGQRHVEFVPWEPSPGTVVHRMSLGPDIRLRATGFTDDIAPHTGQGAFGRGRAPNSAKTLVLGEGMDAVKDAARGLRTGGVDAKWYQAWGKNFPANRPMTPTELNAALARNERWIRQKVKEGYQFYDIGVDATRSVRSPFYELEQRILKELGVKTIPLPR